MHSKKLLSLITVLICMVSSIGAFAQNVTVRGTVSDAAGPIAGAVVLSGGANAVTDLNGNYAITVPSNAVLEVSCLGYQTQNVNVNGRSHIDIVLSEDVEMLQEAVALGYGAQTKKKDLSASVGIVSNPEKLAGRPVTSTTGMLQGQVPGVVVSYSNGSPTSGPGILIRGQGSRNGDSVLWVVDGVPGGPITSMNDIESIVVLKDAASAAIYGATSGAGGVIIVTTKKASQGIHVEYDLVTGIRHASNLPECLTAEEEIQMRTISNANAGLSLETGWDPQVNPWIATTRTDWMDEIFRDALYQRHTATLNYGTDHLKSRLTFTFNDNPGVLVGTYARSLGVRYNGQYQMNKWVKLTENIHFSDGKSRGTDTGSSHTGTILSALYMPPSAEAYASAGPYAGSFGGTTTEDPEYIAQYNGNYAGIHGDAVNPLRLLLADRTYGHSISFWSTTGLEIANIVKGLKFIDQFSYNIGMGLSKSFSPKRPEIGKPSLTNSLNEGASRNDGWRNEATLTYDRTFGKHTVGALGAFTVNRDWNRGFSMSASSFDVEDRTMTYFANTSAYGVPSDYYNNDANIAYVGRLSYSFDDRYFLTASYRRDVAGRLPNEHNHGDFPAVTGAWKISSEPFFPKNDNINLLKIRASWGRVGNLGSIGWHYKSPVLSQMGDNTDNRMAGRTGGENGGNMRGVTYALNNAFNSTLTWETSEQTDLGLDIDLFRERLSMSLDVYNKKTFNLIQEQSTNWPTSIGINPMLVNLGEINNRGIEFVATWKDKIGKDFSYYVTGNYAFNRNRVIDTGVVDASGNAAPWVGGGSYGLEQTAIYRSENGQPLNSFYMIPYEGIFQSWEDVYDHQKDGALIQPGARPGDLKFTDVNGDGRINTDDRVYCGDPTPHHTFALSGGFTWKNFNVDMMLQGVAGNKIAYMAKQLIYADVEGNFSRAKGILNAWSPENRDAVIPILSRNDPNGNLQTPSTWYLEDGSYLRLKNLTIGYDITKLMQRLPHFAERNSSCNIYFSGENIFTLTKYSGMDPEVGGYDTLTYPVHKIFAFGVKLNY
ncbi:MAG: TonB-dependent receptor [Bacteroidales bacterium]|nr:TonB-dependent receptor [Bacteroidales bacterium]